MERLTQWSEKSADFREAAELGQLFAIVETLKVLAEREANAAGLDLPTAAASRQARSTFDTVSRRRQGPRPPQQNHNRTLRNSDAAGRSSKQRGLGVKIPKTHKSMMMELDGTDRTWQQIADAVNKDYGTDYSSKPLENKSNRKAEPDKTLCPVCPLNNYQNSHHPPREIKTRGGFFVEWLSLSKSPSRSRLPGRKTHSRRHDHAMDHPGASREMESAFVAAKKWGAAGWSSAMTWTSSFLACPPILSANPRQKLLAAKPHEIELPHALRRG